MGEKVYLTSDQYVVKELEEKKKEIERLNGKIDELIKELLVAQAKVKENREFKKNFKCNLSVDKTFYKIEYVPKHDSWGTTIIYSNSTDKNNLGDSFKELLDFFELELPELPNEETKEEQ